MPRPTPYQLERALAASDEDVAYWGTRNPERDQNDFAITALANEVRAQREELERHRKWAGDRNYCDSCGKSILNIVTANAIIARIEALVSSDHPLYLDKDDVRAALKGGA